jgi:fucose permease
MILLLVIAYLGFISLGLPDAVLGVAFPSIRATFGLSLDALGLLFVTGTIGYVISSFSSGYFMRKIGIGWLLSGSCAMTGAALLTYALTPSWGLMVGMGFFSGFGGGAIDAGINTFVATHFKPKILNWLHASFGVGATLGPLIMTTVLNFQLSWRWGYVIVAGLEIAMAICFAVTHKLWDLPGNQTENEPKQPDVVVSLISTLKLPIAWFSILLFVVYAGLEVTAGQWVYTLFTNSRSIAPNLAGIMVSLYWGSFTVGRIVFGWIVSLVDNKLLLRLCMVGVVIGCVLVWLNVADIVSFSGLVLIGFAEATIFPTLVSTTPERVGAKHAPNLIGFQIAGASLGVAVLPGLAGILANSFGLEIIGLFLVISALVLILVHELVNIAPVPK